jgi:hypothetical protein
MDVTRNDFEVRQVKLTRADVYFKPTGEQLNTNPLFNEDVESFIEYYIHEFNEKPWFYRNEFGGWKH